jgi:chromate transporter
MAEDSAGREPTSEVEAPRPLSLWQLFGVFLRIGATGFGGVMVLIGMLQEHFVERRRAVTAQEFAEGVAIGQVLPGPVAIDAAIYLGYRLHGWLGALAASVGMILPAFLLMLALTPLYLHYGIVPQVQGFFFGVRPVVVALILAAGWRLGKRSLSRAGTVVIAAAVLAAMLLGGNAILLILLSGTLGILLCPAPGGPSPAGPTASADRQTARPSAGRVIAALVVVLALAGVLALQASRQGAGDLLRLAFAGLRVGTFVFGGGFAMVPLLEQYVVGPAPWLTHQQFVDAVALGQITPGPLLVTATFVGYKVSGVLGATMATACIFLPSFFMTIAASHQLNRIRSNFYVQRCVKGVEAGVVGLVVASAVLIGWTSVHSVIQVVIGVAALVVLLRFKVESWWVVLGAGVVGLAATVVGVTQ